MKKLLTVALTFIMACSFGQKGRFNAVDLGKDFAGYLVTEKNDTIKGTIRIFPQWQMQIGPAFTPSKDIGPQNFNYNNTKCFAVENDTKWYSTKFTKLKAPVDPKRTGPETFVLVVENGPITLYDYEIFDESVTPPARTSKSFIQLADGTVVDVSSLMLGFAKKMPEYVKDYPELASKIANKEKGYGLLNITSVIREYNEWAMAKNPGFTIMK